MLSLHGFFVRGFSTTILFTDDGSQYMQIFTLRLIIKLHAILWLPFVSSSLQ